MKIILLSGNPNAGKTTTFNALFDQITKSGASVIEGRKQIGGNGHDFECVLKIDSKLVALYSMGDYHLACFEAIIKYSHCDILILAYSDKFKNSIAQMLRNYSHHVVVSKTNSNQQDVEMLIGHIQRTDP